MTNITLQEEGRRIYIVGNSYPIKDQIKSAGGHWDADRKQWWIGSGKKEEIEKAIAGASQSSQANRSEIYDGEVQGKAEYKGRQYYVRWSGRTSRGTDAMRLVTLDGKLDFWADAAACRWTKRYEKRGERRHYGRLVCEASYPTLSSLRQYIEDKRAEEKDGVPRTYQAKMEHLDALDQGDCFSEAADYARENGLLY